MPPSFSKRLLQWSQDHGRHDLPWQQDISAYRVWISEVMLQQTQVETVIPYFQRFMQSFPSIQALASSSQDTVLEHWSGLGYYARGRNLHKAAQQVVTEHDGQMPQTLEQMISLPGIGRSTAAAILSIAHGQAEAILDGNVKRVLARHAAIKGWYGEAKVLKEFWAMAERLTPEQDNAAYTQAIMDLGATLCTRRQPRCLDCPVVSDCLAHQQGLQAELPTPKPKKKVPQREVCMLLIRNDNEHYFMQRRPDSGIWGGLLSFPEFAGIEEAKSWAAMHISTQDSVQLLEPLSHTFSHFRLQITPLLLNLAAGAPVQVMEADQWVWYKDGSATGGIAAPVQKILNRLNSRLNK